MAVYDTVTTIFEPDPTCFEPSNLWLSSIPCSTEYPAFESKPDITLTSLTCPITLLGPPRTIGIDDYSCYPYNIYTTGGTAWSDCPMSMTPAMETTSEWPNGIKVAETWCCPSAYEFSSNFNPIPLTVSGSTYSVKLYPEYACRATAVEALSDQTVTLTVSTAPLITTEVSWNDVSMIHAEAARIGRYIYEASGTTSECFNRCPSLSNPLVLPTPTPTPTPVPTNSYIPPPSHATTQFTPAPSCLSESNLWLVSTSCQLLEDRQIMTPPWLKCTIAEFGEPDVYNEACYKSGSATAGDDGTTSFYAGCPVGYTTASESTYRPFDSTRYGKTPRATMSYDVVASVVMCCPDGDYSFQYSDVLTTTTTYDYRQHLVDMYPMPLCVATSVETLSGKDVELTLTVDSRVWDKKRRQDATPGPAVTTRPWDYESALLFAQAAHASVTYDIHGRGLDEQGLNDRKFNK
ncbi:hypothetical protein J7T55_002648 [Diaporthe amygdali]|uniref:uncharacterized protein n=1 Tax=Phomopsis amygdali TaxID=1214568 RepID=UPI0022FF1D38|nr:uncharacterized protein J7T55_002648 [Diaporthe amygdali]KAJ0122136.1 hypothetical protein J7T55_002648 [Diaporthe amygdali]